MKKKSSTLSLLLLLVPLLLAVIATFYLPTANAFSSIQYNSPWKAASWQLILNIGREASTTLPEEWGESGARLSFPIQVQFESDRLPDQQQDPLLGGSGACQITIIDESSITYINEQGEQRVPFQTTTGGWKLRLGRKKGHASLLRFWLDVGTSTTNSKIVAQKKDVTLQAKERLYFAAHCWRQTDWDIGRQKVQPLVDAYQRAQQKIEEQVSHETGDRRLDGSDALETLAAYKDMAGLTLDRDEKRRQLQEAQESLPPIDNLPMGNFPGSTELMVIQPKEVFVQRRKGILPTEEYHLIGTWSARPLNVIAEEEEDEYEYFDEDEEYDGEYEYYDDDDDDEEEDEEVNDKQNVDVDTNSQSIAKGEDDVESTDDKGVMVSTDRDNETDIATPTGGLKS